MTHNEYVWFFPGPQKPIYSRRDSSKNNIPNKMEKTKNKTQVNVCCSRQFGTMSIQKAQLQGISLTTQLYNYGLT